MTSAWTWPRPLERPATRVEIYAGLLFAIGVGLWVAMASGGVLWGHPQGLWRPPQALVLLLLLGAFTVTECTALTIERKEQSHTISMTTLPLIYGLMVASVPEVTLARMLAGGIAGYAVRRSPKLKLGWNLSLFFIETAVAAAMIRGFLGLELPAGFGEWVLVLVAAVSAEFIGFVAVPIVIMLHEPRWRWRWDLFDGPMVPHALVALASSFAIVAIAASQQEEKLMLFAVVSLTGVAYFTHSHGGLSRQHKSLKKIHEFTTSFDTDAQKSAEKREPVQVIDPGLEQLAEMLTAKGAGVLVADPKGNPFGRLRTEDGASDLTVPFSLEQMKELDISRNGVKVERSSANAFGPLFELLDAQKLLVAKVMVETETPGLLFVYDRKGVSKDFQKDEEELFGSLARTFGTRLSNDHFIDALATQAKRDVLTGLTNRSEFEKHLRARFEKSEEIGSGAVAIIDLDRFKDVNDTLGHAIGDRLLKAVAERVQAAVRPGDLVARVGGDEMALIISSATEPADVEQLLESVRVAIAEPTVEQNIVLTVGASVGYALWPADGSDEPTLVRRADLAMYEAKRSRAGVVRYEPAYDENMPRRLRLAADLRAACAQGELDVLLQPKVRADTLELTGFEALCRYQHPEHKRIGPVELIELAERGGYLGQLTRTVISIAARHAATLRREMINVPIAVNLAPSDALDESVPDHFVAATREAGLEPSALSCEIDQLVGFGQDDLAASGKVIDRLRGLGIRIALDDFGTGAAPLMVLHHVDVDEIKLDQLFVAAVTRSEVAGKLVRSTIELARHLGVRCVAEGVEELQVMELLQVMGCDQLQGNLISPPLKVEDVAAWSMLWDSRRLTMQAAGTLAGGESDPSLNR